MAGNNLHAGLGEFVLKELAKKKKQLADLEQRIRELSGRLYTTPSVDLERPLVDHSRVLDRLEKNAVTLHALEEEREWLEGDLEQFLWDLECVRNEMEPSLWSRLEEMTSFTQGTGEEASSEETVLRETALSQMWQIYHRNARRDPLEEARHCLYIKRYFESLVIWNRLTREEAEQRMAEEAQMSIRGIYRKIRLLYLERDIRDWLAAGRISETGAYHLSFLKRSQQRMVINLAEQKTKRIRITPKIALTLRECSFSDWYHVERIREIIHQGRK